MRYLASDAAWAAGLFDGEGSVSAHFLKQGPQRGTFRIRLSLGMNCHRAVTRFHEIVGVGTVHRLKKQLVWSASHQAGVLALDVIHPYLCVKYQQASIYRELASRSRDPRTMDIHQWRAERAERVQSLNSQSA